MESPLLLLGNVDPGTMGGRLSEAAMLAVVGMGVVFFGLILLNLLLSALNKMPRKAEAPVVQKPTAAAVAPVPPPAEDGIEPEIMAALTAAAIAAIGRPVKIKSVKLAGHEPSHAWAEHGRAAIHTSHNLRKGTR